MDGPIDRLASARHRWTVTPNGPSSGATERLIDRTLDHYRDPRITCGSQQLFEPGGGSRPVTQKTLTDELFVGCLIRPHEVTVIPRNQLRSKVPGDPSGLQVLSVIRQSLLLAGVVKLLFDGDDGDGSSSRRRCNLDLVAGLATQDG